MIERLQLWFVWRLPRWVAYWCAVRVGALATTGKYGAESPTSLELMTALKRWREQ
jgi:hypothetical protein